jgi:ABC-type transporter Mla maintaining outer membrane lipid asymmetry ATPase subunit MlaF
MNASEQQAAARGSIELKAVTKRFGDTVAVKNIDLKIPGGAYCCLLGPSGCGKTTILAHDRGARVADRRCGADRWRECSRIAAGAALALP